MSEVVIRADRLSKRYILGTKAIEKNQFWAIKDLSFDIAGGHVVGVIGNNGAGKSTLLKILSRITEPTSGSVEIRGRVGSLLEVGTGFHPELSGRENIFLNGAIIGMKREDIRKKFDEIVAFAGVDEFLDTPIKRYSSGMHMRLAFSVAAHLDPDILIVDEVLAVGDAEFQKKCLGKLEDVATRSHRTVLFVSHNLQAVQSLCNRAMHLDHGRLVAFGDTRSVVGQYLTRVSSNESVRQWDGDAPGNDYLRLKRITVSSDNNRSGIYSSSHAISIEMHVEALREPRAASIGFELTSAEGVVILRTSQTDSRPDWVGLSKIGLNRWRCALPPGLLNAGVYQVSPRISDENHRVIVDLDAAVSFEMVLDHGVSPYWNSLSANSRPGVIAPILDWKAVDVPSSVCGPATSSR
jgi:lipopolysaccharide transport system ATP-binding protein